MSILRIRKINIEFKQTINKYAFDRVKSILNSIKKLTKCAFDRVFILESFLWWEKFSCIIDTCQILLLY